MLIPAVCDNCATLFPSGFGIGESAIGTFVNCGSGPCPKCGGHGHIPDGIYEAVGNTIKLLRITKRTIAELEQIKTNLNQTRRNEIAVDQIEKQITKEIPELLKLKNIIPKKRADLYAFISMIVAIITLIIECRNMGQLPNIEINEVINNVYQQQDINQVTNNIFLPQESNATKISKFKGHVEINKDKRTKIGRNDPCPCGSGKKFKKCCGRGN